MMQNKDQRRELVQRIHSEVCEYLDAQGQRFPSRRKLLKRLTAACRKYEEGASLRDSGLREFHNEACVAALLLELQVPPVCVRLDYEPVLRGCGKRIDFCVLLDDGTSFVAEVKTISPEWKNDWGKYIEAVEHELLPDNVYVHYEKDWLGGEFWHNKVAARSKMLEYSLEFERTLAACGINSLAVLVFCTDGFKWHRDELEAFVSFYNIGAHRQDDPFSKMERHYIETKGITLSRRIDHFGCLIRPDTDVRPRLMVLPVRPPPEPWLGD